MRENFLKSYIWSVSVYGSELWMIGKGERKDSLKSGAIEE